MSILGTWSVQGIYDGRKFDKGIKKSRKVVVSFGKSVVKMGSVVATTLAAAGVAAAVFAERYTRATLELDRFAKGIGIANHQLLAFHRIGKELGVSTENMNDALLEINKRAGEAAIDGTGPLVEVFEKLNINAEKFVRLPIDQKLLEANKAIKGLNVSVAEQNFLWDEFMGGASDGLVGRYDELAEGIEKTNTALDKLEMDQALEFAQKWDDITKRLRAMGRGFVIDIGPEVIKVLDRIERLLDFDKTRGLKEETALARKEFRPLPKESSAELSTRFWQTNFEVFSSLFSPDFGASYRAGQRARADVVREQIRTAERRAPQPPVDNQNRVVVLEDAALGGG